MTMSDKNGGKILSEELGLLRRRVAELEAGEQRRNAAEQELQRQFEFENLITSISTEFINLPTAEIDSRIHDALGKVGRYVETDRSHVFLFSESGKHNELRVRMVR